MRGTLYVQDRSDRQVLFQHLAPNQELEDHLRCLLSSHYGLLRFHYGFLCPALLAEIISDLLNNRHFSPRLLSIPCRWDQYTTIEHYGTFSEFQYVAIIEIAVYQTSLYWQKKHF